VGGAPQRAPGKFDFFQGWGPPIVSGAGGGGGGKKKPFFGGAFPQIRGETLTTPPFWRGGVGGVGEKPISWGGFPPFGFWINPRFFHRTFFQKKKPGPPLGPFFPAGVFWFFFQGGWGGNPQTFFGGGPKKRGEKGTETLLCVFFPNFFELTGGGRGGCFSFLGFPPYFGVKNTFAGTKGGLGWKKNRGKKGNFSPPTIKNPPPPAKGGAMGLAFGWFLFSRV